MGAEGIYSLLQRTFGERVMPNPGGPGALFSLDYNERLFRQNYRHPILVSAAGGVGPRLELAAMAGRHETVGVDLVAACVNDVLAQGAEPLFMLDYLAGSGLAPEVRRQVVAGIADGCRQAGCSLLGGRTAETPGACEPGQYELAGFAVGIVERARLVDGSKVEPGDLLVGLPSSGLHSAGHALARRLFLEEARMRPEDSLERFGIGRTLAEELLAPARIYVRPVRAALFHYRVKMVVTGIAHIAEGGLTGSIPRALPEGCGAELDEATWRRPAVFDALRQLGGLSAEEMHGTFNMGIGMVLIVSPYYAASVMRTLSKEGEEPALIGRVVEGARQVSIL
jgi:phosphoribosylformylglycinamidine cyclo-ligase